MPLTKVDPKMFGGGAVLQVLQTVVTAPIGMTTGITWTDIPGATVSITPSSTNSKVLAEFIINGGITQAANCFFRFVRNSTAICVGDANGSAVQSSANSLYNGANASHDNNYMVQATGKFLDSPSANSSTTYKLQIYVQGTATVIMGREASQASDNISGTAPSVVLTVSEIAG